MENENPSSESLAAIVVAFRYFGLYKDEARNAMIELMRRKDSGDSFDFEKFINEKFINIPKSNIDPNMVRFLNSLSIIGRFK
jgi:hypothetical protein